MINSLIKAIKIRSKKAYLILKDNQELYLQTQFLEIMTRLNNKIEILRHKISQINPKNNLKIMREASSNSSPLYPNLILQLQQLVQDRSLQVKELLCSLEKNPSSQEVFLLEET